MSRGYGTASYVCKGVCIRYEKAPPTGFNVGNRHTRLNPYSDLHQKYCWECDYNYYRRDWSSFKNPHHCNCCGMKMRVRPASGRKKEFVRY